MPSAKGGFRCCGERYTYSYRYGFNRNVTKVGNKAVLFPEWAFLRSVSDIKCIGLLHGDAMHMAYGGPRDRASFRVCHERSRTALPRFPEAGVRPANSTLSTAYRKATHRTAAEEMGGHKVSLPF